jgi:hypothetical protein
MEKRSLTTPGGAGDSQIQPGGEAELQEVEGTYGQYAPLHKAPGVRWSPVAGLVSYGIIHGRDPARL